MSAHRFTFRYPEWCEIDAHKWVAWWAARYGGADNPEYFALIDKKGTLAAEVVEHRRRYVRLLFGWYAESTKWQQQKRAL
jgi:hypothetical protein